RFYSFSSILKNGLNEADYGSGKPLWVTILGFTADYAPIPDTVSLMEATAGDDDGAVEAWLNLNAKEMAISQQDPHLLQYATVNPSIRLS
ncbi:unnamed protein product, partial [Linum tenue]